LAQALLRALSPPCRGAADLPLVLELRGALRKLYEFRTMSRGYGPDGPVAVIKPEESVPPVVLLDAAERQQPSGETGSKQQPQAPEGSSSTMFICSSLDQWHSLQADNYQGLRVVRPMDPLQWQFVADRFSEMHGEGIMLHLHKETIDLDSSDGEDSLQLKFLDAATAVSQGLEPPLAMLVSQDAQALASATRKLVPQAKQLIMKLELFGTNSCLRWHTDWYVCRSIVSYNFCALEYTADSNVDFYAFENGGENEDIIRDTSRIQSAGVGDMVLIKGNKFPGKAKCLVHKSPELTWYDNGRVKTRLVLKVDVLNLDSG